MNFAQAQVVAAMEAAELEPGTDTRIVCPFCEAEHERSFVLRKDENSVVSGYCWRSTCGKGIRPENQGPVSQQVERKFTPREFTGTTTQLPNSVSWSLARKYGIPHQDMIAEGWKYVPEQKRLYMPLYNYLGYKYGAITKRLTEDGSTKVLNYLEKDSNKLHYPITAQISTDYIVAVEDVISAVRVAQVAPSVALLGTHITPEQITELTRIADRLVLALDPDALAKAFKIRRKYNALFKRGISVRTPDCDPKDYATNEKLLESLGL